MSELVLELVQNWTRNRTRTGTEGEPRAVTNLIKTDQKRDQFWTCSWSYFLTVKYTLLDSAKGCIYLLFFSQNTVPTGRIVQFLVKYRIQCYLLNSVLY